MNKKLYDKVILLLNIKKDKLREVLIITQNTLLTPSEDSVDDYVKLVNERQVIFDFIKGIDDKINSYNLEDFWSDNSLGSDAHGIAYETHKVVLNIVELDKQNKLLVEGIICNIKKGIKEINQGKAISSFYQTVISPIGTYFDYRN